MLLPFIFAAATSLFASDASIAKAFESRTGTLVLIDCASGKIQRYNTTLATKAVAPCSTFKIWNTAIGLETGILTSADQPFWKWDGVNRGIEPWNHDLTLRQAYAVSCVPAYQTLARRIGPERMNEWLKKLNYGNQDATSGNDVFWLPAPGRTPLLITADTQAQLMRNLANGDVPFSSSTQAVLKDIMQASATNRGTLYGKTGTSGSSVTPELGWFVGYLITDKKKLAFACLLIGPHAAGKDARTLVEQLFTRQGLL